MNEQLLELMGRFKTIIHDDLSLTNETICRRL